MKNDKVKILYDDGEAFRRWGRLEEAEQCYLKALDCEGGSHNHKLLSGISELFLEKKDPRLALEYYSLAIQADRSNLLYKQRFLDIGGAQQLEHYNADVEDGLLQCLRTPGLDFHGAGPLWSTLLINNPEFALLYKDRQLFEKTFNPAPLLQPYFLEGLKKLSVQEPGFEDFIRRLRQWLLMGLPSRTPLSAADHLRLADSVAAYCFYSGYIIRVTAAERARLREIAPRLNDPLFATIHACYGLREVPAGVAPESALGVIHNENEQIKTEQMHAGWRTVPFRTLEAKLFFPARKEKLERTFAGTKPELLVAGCRTGREAIIAALYYPGGKITAIDPCRENIAYASVKSHEYGVNNIDWRQEDISTLAKIPKPYDIIYSDVLHHLPEPEKAWQILWDNLKPAGVMKIGLASKTAYRWVAATRHAIRKFNIGGNRESILDFRARSVDLLPPEALENLSRLSDYYTYATYRDLFFHPDMQLFTLPEIEETLANLRLVFEGFDLPADILQQYAKRFPEDTQMNSLKNWHIFEQETPDTFAGLYRFWCRRI